MQIRKRIMEIMALKGWNWVMNKTSWSFEPSIDCCVVSGIKHWVFFWYTSEEDMAIAADMLENALNS